MVKAMQSDPMYIVAADAVIDGAGDLTTSRAAREKLRSAGCRVTHFDISSSGDGWQSPLPPNTLRCACSPMMAIERARARAMVVLPVPGTSSSRTLP